MGLWGLRFLWVLAWPWPVSTRATTGFVWRCTAMVLRTRGKSSKPTTWRISGSFRAFLCVKTMVMEWEPVQIDLQAIPTTFSEETSCQESGSTEWMSWQLN
uniref:(northern house mosquito) hypothetical protein n=1 Tax=Culex pipiens TaxID=7175 RepID=A0A8D8FZA7_CULPI